MTAVVQFRRRPSALAYMVRAFHCTRPWDPARGVPALRFAWQGLRVDERDVAAFLELTGLPRAGPVPVLYLHVAGFRLLMALLTHPAWPLPIWRALQVRNHLLQRVPVAVGAQLDLETRVAGQRVLDKGLEVDLHTRARGEGEAVWESLVTFYYRGAFGSPGAPPALARAPDTGPEELARWRTTGGVGLRFGRLTGDYNGIHLWTPYARLFGFARAFHHPQLVLGQCVARLPPLDPAQPQRLDAWLKGPVCYGSEVVLRGRSEPGSRAFALYVGGDARPAIVGRWSAQPLEQPSAAPAPQREPAANG